MGHSQRIGRPGIHGGLLSTNPFCVRNENPLLRYTGLAEPFGRRLTHGAFSLSDGGRGGGLGRCRLLLLQGATDGEVLRAPGIYKKDGTADFPATVRRKTESEFDLFCELGDEVPGDSSSPP